MMEPSRAIVVLHTACTTLHFDGAELWNVSTTGSFSSLNLIGHYAPANKVSLPTVPRNGVDLSPLICRTTCDKSGQIVWVTSKQEKGLFGSSTSGSSLPVMTACGMPLCCVQGSMFIMVLFGVSKMTLTPHSLEMLISISRVATEGTSIGFCPPTRILPSDVSKFGSSWCVQDRLNANHMAVLDCQVMDIDRLQAFFDYAEMAAFHELLLEDKKSEDDTTNKTLNAGNLTKITDSNSHHAGFPALPFNTLRKVASCSTTSDEYNNHVGSFSSTVTCVSRPGSPLVLDEEEPLSKRPKVESTTAPTFPSQHLDSKGRRCKFEDCTKYAQGSTCYCIKHGGGRRCTVPMCSKGARDKFYCALHGGGKRCEVTACFKSAVGGSMFCTAHGGGKRCRFINCGRSAQSSTFFCVKHGGGRKCQMDFCTKVARGKTSYCAGHGRKMRGEDMMFDNNPYCTEISL